MKKKQFKTESRRILDLMINSIYTNKEIFLRELISNASDAMDKLYYQALTDGGLSVSRSDFEILLAVNKDIRTLTMWDNGIGMTQAELEDNLGTIARSGTMDFREKNRAGLDGLKKTADSENGAEPDPDDDTAADAGADADSGAADSGSDDDSAADTPNEAAAGTDTDTAAATDAAPADTDTDAAADADGTAGADIAIIGQFGVGFYSAFMVSKRITVISKAYGSDEAWKWQSDGADGYVMEPCQREGWGTTIILEIKPNQGDEDFDQFLEQHRIAEIVKRYSDYIRYPIRMEMTKSRPKAKDPAAGKDDKTPTEYESYQETETLNSMVPLWRRNKNEVSQEEYERFYTEKFYDYEKPLSSLHVSVEGAVSYNGILYVPGRAPYNYYSKEYEKGLQLYANGVLIMEKCADLLPDCFSFIKGLVDSPDLSLNISREMLQQDRQVQAIAKSLEKKIRAELLRLQKNDREKYESFFKAFGLQLKFGIYNSFGGDKEKLRDLLLYASLKEDKLITLAEYRQGMPAEQEAIYYACGGSVARIRQLPQTELVLDKGYDILALTDDVDEFAVKILRDYDGKPLKSVSDKDLNLADDEEKDEAKEQSEDDKALFELMREALGDKVKEVRLSKRLKSHPACLTSDGPLSLEMEKVLNSMPADQKVKADRVLEINGGHPVFAALTRLREEDPEKLKTYALLLYNQALMIEGLALEDPVAFANAICALMA